MKRARIYTSAGALKAPRGFARVTFATAQLGQAFLVEALFVLLAPLLLVCLGFRELLLDPRRFGVVACLKLARSRLATHGDKGDDDEWHRDSGHDDPGDHAPQRTALSSDVNSPCEVRLCGPVHAALRL